MIPYLPSQSFLPVFTRCKVVHELLSSPLFGRNPSFGPIHRLDQSIVTIQVFGPLVFRHGAWGQISLVVPGKGNDRRALGDGFFCGDHFFFFT